MEKHDKSFEEINNIMKFDKLIESIMENVEVNIVQMVLSLLDANSIKYEKEERDYTEGAIKHSVEYSFTTSGEYYEIEEFLKANGRKFIKAYINSDSTDETDDGVVSYDDYQMANMRDFVLRLKNALKA